MHTDFYCKVKAYNHNTNTWENLTFYGTTREQAEGRYNDWKLKAGKHFEIDTVVYGKTNKGA